VDDELHFTKEEIPASQLTRDLSVNPRDGSDSWARQHLPKYHPGLLGLFIISERIVDGQPQYIVLDGSNRLQMMRLAGDLNRPVLCQVFHGLTIEQEAKTAREFNDRRAWMGVRVFLARVTEGDPVANAINDIAIKNGWRFDTGSEDGIIRGSAPFEKLILIASLRAVEEINAKKGSERWAAAMESGKQDGLRVLEEALQVYTTAFPERPSGYVGRIVCGIALLLLRDGPAVLLDRLATNLRDKAHSAAQLRRNIQSMKDAMQLPFEDATAYTCIRFYNTGLQRNSRVALDENWIRMYR
jgi:hypothetical protein